LVRNVNIAGSITAIVIERSNKERLQLIDKNELPGAYFPVGKMPKGNSF
jgi:hypothetical protein